MERNQIEKQDRPKRTKWHKILVAFSFAGYLILLCYFLFFAEVFGRTNMAASYHYNLIPFQEIKRFIQYRKILGKTAVLLNLLGNVAAFLPFGAMVPFFSGKCKNVWFTTFVSFELSLLVETLQLISKVGSFDVDDLMLNTLGGMLGYLCYWCARKIHGKYYGKKKL